MSDEQFTRFLSERRIGVLATIRRDGRPQTSPVTYVHSDGMLRVSTRDSLAKTHNLRRDPRCTMTVLSDDGWSYVVAECRAELLPVAQQADDASVEELIDIYRAAAGEHSDWDDYRRAMVAEGRVPLHLHIERVTGLVR